MRIIEVEGKIKTINKKPLKLIKENWLHKNVYRVKKNSFENLMKI